MTIETLGKCYISNINQLFKMIELPSSSFEAYQNQMQELKWIDPPKNQKEGENLAPAPSPSKVLTTTTNKKIQPILKVVFQLNQSKQPK